MKPLYLRFENEQAARDALLANGFELTEDGELYHPKCSIDAVGVIHGELTIDDNGNVINQEPDIEGWHVNLLVHDDYTPPKSSVVVTVKTPVRRWAG